MRIQICWKLYGLLTYGSNLNFMCKNHSLYRCGLRLGFASIPGPILCWTVIIYIYIYIYIYSRSLTILKNCVYICIHSYILDSYMVPFQYNTSIWWNPSVPLRGKTISVVLSNSGYKKPRSYMTQNRCHSCWSYQS